MKKRFCFLMLIAFALGFLSITKVQSQSANTNKSYLKITEQEKTAFVADKLREVSKKISGNEYAPTPSFEKMIRPYLDRYARRVGNQNTEMWGEDINFLLKRGGEFAPAINSAFDKNGMPRLMGLYLCMIETEFHNITSDNFAGTSGLFQFTASMAKQYGLKPEDRTDPSKAADFAVRYLKDSQTKFEQYQMKEALALLSYNRSPNRIEKDLKLVLNNKNKSCSICALTENSSKLDKWFQGESVKYVPKFFAAAIVGENPQAFDLKTEPLSTLN
jgi:Txe/YoeB family toxin of Txe-Axe toxin-antitoxin module